VFRRSVKVTQQLSLLWWEDRGQRGVGEGKDFNAFALIFQMNSQWRTPAATPSA
jgi:hypothetical protein